MTVIPPLPGMWRSTVCPNLWYTHTLLFIDSRQSSFASATMDVDWEVVDRLIPSYPSLSPAETTPFDTPRNGTPAPSIDSTSTLLEAPRAHPGSATAPTCYIALDTNILVSSLPTVAALHTRLLSSASSVWILVGQQAINGAFSRRPRATLVPSSHTLWTLFPSCA